MRSRDGFVFVSGEVRSGEDGTRRAEILDGAALLVYTVVESRRAGESELPTWRTDHESVDPVPFVVEDPTGEALVDLPEDAEVSVAKEVTETVSHDALMVTTGEMADDVPDGVREYVDSHDTAPTYTRRYRQGAVQPGDSVTVLAEAVEGPVGFDSPVVTLTGDDHPRGVALSDGNDLGHRTTRGWLLMIGLGAYFLLVGTGLAGLIVATAVP